MNLYSPQYLKESLAIGDREERKRREKKRGKVEEGIPFSPKPNFGIIPATLIWMPYFSPLLMKNRVGGMLKGLKRVKMNVSGWATEGEEEEVHERGHQKESLWKSGGG